MTSTINVIDNNINNILNFHKICMHFLLGDRLKTIPNLHKELFTIYNSNKRQINVICPVGFAKSTTLKNYGLYELLNTDTHFILYCSSTFAKVVDQFTSIIKILKKKSFQELYNFNIVSSSQTEIIIKMQNGENKCIKGVASSSDILGIQFESHRPKLILVDDIEELEQAKNLNRTIALNDWLEASLISRLPSLVCGKIIMIGTNLSKISIINQILTDKIKGWDFYKFTCYDQNGNSWWEEQHPTEALKNMEHLKPYVFARNYLNSPLDLSNGLLKSEHIQYFDINYIPPIIECTMHYDLTGTAKNTSDYSCIGIVGRGQDNNYYIIDWHLSKELDPEAQAKYALSFYLKHKHRNITRFTFDAIGNDGFGKFARNMAKDKNISLPLESKKYNKDKVSHFINHQSHFISGRIFLNSTHLQFELAQSQLLNFPYGTHDDFVDMVINCLDDEKNIKIPTILNDKYLEYLQ